MNKTLFHKIHLHSLSIAFIGLLFPLKISSICVFLFAIISIIKLIVFKNKIPKKINKRVFLFAGFYLIYIFGLFYTENIKTAQQHLERNVTWLLLPFLVFFTLQNLSKKTFFKAILPFAIVTQLFALFYLITSIISYNSSGNNLDFYYENLTSYTGFHPVYFSVYLFFSVVIFLCGFAEKHINSNFFLKVIFILFNCLLFVLLSSKSVLFLVLIFSTIYLAKYLKKQRKLFFLPLVFILFIIGIFSFSNTKTRINDAVFSKWELLQKDQFLYNDAFTGVTLRLITWKFVTKKIIAKENVLIGVGTGDGQDFIDSVYKEHNMDAGGYLGFNMHNQFLEYFVRFGFIGLLYFLVIIFICFKKAVVNKDNLYLWFLIAFTAFSITESTLEVHRGIVFFTLFNSFFYFNSKSRKLINL